MEQRIIAEEKSFEILDHYLLEKHVEHIFLVCGKSFQKFTDIKAYFTQLNTSLGIQITFFSEFTPNPLYEEVVAGVNLYKKNDCDAIFAIGGGSALDVAKCIKLFVTMDDQCNYLQQVIAANNIPFVVMPTTAGTGSESTKYAVIYYNGEKQSVTHESSIPDVVLLNGTVLESLPLYQRKATMLDAFCHGIEAFWSVNSTIESEQYATQAIRLILDNMIGYLNNHALENYNMLVAANYAGKAINITQTTAGHAMCYKLTTLFGISHGHAAALCVQHLWRYMLRHKNDCIDNRGQDYLEAMFERLAMVLGGKTAEEGANIFTEIVQSLKLDIPIVDEAAYSILKKSVNVDRLKNNPIALDEVAIELLYRQITVQGDAV